MFEVLLATDAPWTESSVTAALLAPEFKLSVLREGSLVTEEVTRTRPDLLILDLQGGNMGGIAVEADLEISLDRDLGSIPVLLLLDREADSWLANRFGADAWLVKPASAAALARAARELARGAEDEGSARQTQ